MKIFDGVISPILLYNSEVWGAYEKNDYNKWDNTGMEKTHQNFNSANSIRELAEEQVI